MSFSFLAYQKNLIRNQYAETGGHLLVALLRNQDKATPGGSGSHLAEEGSHHTGFTTFDANSWSQVRATQLPWFRAEKGQARFGLIGEKVAWPKR